MLDRDFSMRVLRRPKHVSEEEIRGGNRPGDSEIIDKYLELDRRYTGAVQPHEDLKDDNVSGMQIASFHPNQSARSNLNNHSVVTFMLTNSTVCVPGDNEAASWRERLENRTFCD